MRISLFAKKSLVQTIAVTVLFAFNVLAFLSNQYLPTPTVMPA